MNKIIYWILRIIPVVIMLQTLWFKFTAHPQSVKLFTILVWKPWGRISIGIFELIASVLLLINCTVLPGAFAGYRADVGAIFSILPIRLLVFTDGDPVLFILCNRNIIVLRCTGDHKAQGIPALLQLKF